MPCGLFFFHDETDAVDRADVDRVGERLDPAAYLDYAGWLALPPPRTHFREIPKLAAGSYLTLPLAAAEAPVVKKYWSYQLDAAPDLTAYARSTAGMV